MGGTYDANATGVGLFFADGLVIDHPQKPHDIILSPRRTSDSTDLEEDETTSEG